VYFLTLPDPELTKRMRIISKRRRRGREKEEKKEEEWKEKEGYEMGRLGEKRMMRKRIYFISCHFHAGIVTKEVSSQNLFPGGLGLKLWLFYMII
jgi:hypothetical protein